MVLVYAVGCSHMSADSLYAESFDPEEINDRAIHSDDSSLILGLSGGTLGFGLNVAHPLNDFMSVRFNINALNVNRRFGSRFSAVLEEDKRFHLDTKGLLLDINLWQLRLTGGLYLNNNTIEATTRPEAGKEVILNGRKYGVDKIRSVKSITSTNKIAPYIGVGWGYNRSNEGWNFTLDIGLMYHGSPKMDFSLETAEGLSASDKQDIDKAFEIEKRKQKRDTQNLSIYPVVMIGMSYNF